MPDRVGLVSISFVFYYRDWTDLTQDSPTFRHVKNSDKVILKILSSKFTVEKDNVFFVVFSGGHRMPDCR
jgi:hypothetical protein